MGFEAAITYKGQHVKGSRPFPISAMITRHNRDGTIAELGIKSLNARSSDCFRMYVDIFDVHVIIVVPKKTGVSVLQAVCLSSHFRYLCCGRPEGVSCE